jgi:hypothetical protein
MLVVEKPRADETLEPVIVIAEADLNLIDPVLTKLDAALYPVDVENTTPVENPAVKFEESVNIP